MIYKVGKKVLHEKLPVLFFPMHSIEISCWHESYCSSKTVLFFFVAVFRKNRETAAFTQTELKELNVFNSWFGDCIFKKNAVARRHEIGSKVFGGKDEAKFVKFCLMTESLFDASIYIITQYSCLIYWHKIHILSFGTIFTKDSTRLQYFTELFVKRYNQFIEFNIVNRLHVWNS